MGYDGGRNIAGFGLVPPVDDPNGIIRLTPANDDFLQLKSGLWVNRTVAQVRADLNSQETIATDAAFSLVVGTNAEHVLHTGTLTADRAVTLSTSGAARGAKFKITRTGGGAYLLNVGTGPLKALSQYMWAEFVFDGSAWYLSAHGFTDGTAFGQSLVNDADATAGRTTLGALLPASVFISSTGPVSNVASIDFTTGFSSDFDEYVFVLRSIKSNTGTQAIRVGISNNAGSSYVTSVRRGSVVLGSTATAAGATNAAPDISPAIDGSDEAGGGEVRVIKGVNKTYVTALMFAETGAATALGMVTAFSATTLTTAVNAIKYYAASGNISAEDITMYGVKNS